MRMQKALWASAMPHISANLELGLALGGALEEALGGDRREELLEERVRFDRSALRRCGLGPELRGARRR